MSEISPIGSLIADCRLSRKRLAETPLASVEEMSRELRNNIYPMFMAMLEQIAEQDEIIQDVVDQQGSFIEPELAEQIFLTIAAGGALVTEVKALLPQLDDVTQRKITKIIESFEHAAELSFMGVTDASASDDVESDDAAEVSAEESEGTDV